jgi:hypothetical protein
VSDQVMIFGAVMGVILLAVMAHTIRFISRKHDERDWIAMKSKTERKNKWII